MKQEAIETFRDFAGLFPKAPDVPYFDAEDSHGTVIVDSGKHFIPGVLIGVGLSMYMDSIRKRVPMVSTKIGTMGAFALGFVYEGIDACGDTIPGVQGVEETCKAGYLDGKSQAIATLDSVADLVVTGGGGFVGGLTIAAVALAIRRKRNMYNFYEMTEEEISKDLSVDIIMSEKNKEMVRIIQPRNNIFKRLKNKTIFGKV